MEELFNGLLVKLQEQGTITESDKSEMSEKFKTKLVQMKEQLYLEATTKQEALTESAIKDKTEKLVELKEAFEKRIGELEEEHKSELDKVEELVTEKTTTLVDTLKETFNSEKEALEESLKAKFAESKAKLIETYEADAALREAENKIAVEDELIEALSDIVDTYVESALPEPLLVDMERAQKLEETFNKMKKMLFVNEEFVQKEIVESVQDAQNIIKQKDDKINELIKEQIELNKKVNKIEVASLLAEKTKGMSPKLKAYINTRFSDASIDVIEESLDEACKVFEREEMHRLEEARRDAEEQSIVNPEVIIEEQTTQSKEQTMVDLYAASILKNKRRKK